MQFAFILYVLGRLREPSTYAGTSGIALALAQMFPQYADLLNTGAAFLGSIAVVVADRSAKLARDAGNGP